jgi:small subunit ribosomal protein S18
MARKIDVVSSQIDYKNLKLIKQFITRYGKIVPRQYTKVSLKDQKRIARAIKNARYMALVPFVR